MTAEERPPFWTVEEVAEYARVHFSTVYRAIREGELEAGRTHGRYRIRPEKVDEWLERPRRDE